MSATRSAVSPACWTNPLSFVPGGVAVTAVQASAGALGALDQRSRNIQVLDDLEHDSLDFYATLRTIQRQRRDALIEQGKAPDLAEKDASTSRSLTGMRRSPRA